MIMERMRALRNTAVLFFSVWLAVSPTSLAASGQEREGTAGGRSKSRFSLRLNGGLSLPDTGDINGMIRSYGEGTARIQELGQTSSISWKEIKSVPEASLELRYELSKRVSVGFEGGFVHKKFPGTWSFEADLTDVDILQELRFDDSFDIIPVVISGYYYFHRGRLDMYLKGGLGMYFGRYELNEAAEQDNYYHEEGYEGEYHRTITDHGVAHGASLGLHSGLGMEWRISGGLGLNIEALFRKCSIKNWDGYLDRSILENERSGELSSSSATAYVFNQHINLGFHETSYFVGDGVRVDRVELYDIGNGKPADIRLDGISIKIGIRVSL